MKKLKLNRKERREFDKLPEETKAKILHEQVVSRVMESVGKEVRDAFISGILYEKEDVYKKYVEKYDFSESYEEQEGIILNFLSDMRKSHILYLKNKKMENVGEKIKEDECQ